MLGRSKMDSLYIPENQGVDMSQDGQQYEGTFIQDGVQGSLYDFQDVNGIQTGTMRETMGYSVMKDPEVKDHDRGEVMGMVRTYQENQQDMFDSKILSGTGHALMTEQPNRITEHLKAFLMSA